MSNLSKLEFVALDISGNNYLSWVLDAEIHLDAKGLGATITNGNTTSSQDKAKAMIFLRHHLDEGLKVEYLTVKDPLELWTGLKEMYDHLKATVLPRARYEWIHLRLQDFKTICEYNSAARPTGTASLPEANEVEAHGQSERRQNKNQGQNNVRGRGNGRGRYNNRRHGGRHKRENNMGSQSNPSRGNCHRYGLKGHWKNECRAAEHFVRLYQDSLKRKGNKNGASSSNARVESHLTYKNDAEAGPSQKYDDNIEANLALKDDDFGDLDDITHLEVEDFFGDQN
ncbi:uncharacterized protein LOC125825536 [Solanum verrucosum]|uniref:uncharacterized protein LOC125825536 n=1 Tax=Solanum verrucosum TaxID=315347 RepID=UPI0020D174CA|nr:uncharacterized protein LOC125825536 [Solanum verrucosum]